MRGEEGGGVKEGEGGGERGEGELSGEWYERLHIPSLSSSGE